MHDLRRLYSRTIGREADEMAQASLEDLIESEFTRAKKRGLITRRVSDNLPGVPPQHYEAIEAMVQQFGLFAVLRTLREIADGRGDCTDMQAAWDELDTIEAWAAAADALEGVLTSGRVNIK